MFPDRWSAAEQTTETDCPRNTLVNQRRLVLQNPSAHVEDLLQRTNLHLLFEVVNSDEERELSAAYHGAAS